MQRIRRLIGEYKQFLVFVLCIILIRSAVVDWYAVPSGSMYPTVLIGDRVLSNRLAYDLKLPFTDIVIRHIADPKRGDLVTFSSPEDGVRLVKRIVGVPGDVVEMHNDALTINGVDASYAAASGEIATHFAPNDPEKQLVLNERILGHQRTVILLQQREALRSFDRVTVPPDQYLVLGDNRDNSKDSRYIGFVRRELLSGQVNRVVFSLDADHFYLPRTERFWVSLS